MDIEDLIFVKALPLNESQVNQENLDEFQNLEEIFHSFNVDLMFTLEAMTTRFIEEPVEQPDLQEVGQILASEKQFSQRNSKSQKDEEEQDEEGEKRMEINRDHHYEDDPFQLEERPATHENKKKVMKVASALDQHSTENQKTSAPVIEDQSQSEHEEISRQTFGEAQAAPPMNQQVGRIEQKVEPDNESIHISKHGNSSRADMSIANKSMAKNSLNASVNPLIISRGIA